MTARFYLTVLVVFAAFVLFHKLFWQRPINKKHYFFGTLALSLVFLNYYHLIYLYIEDTFFNSFNVHFAIYFLIVVIAMPIMLYIINRPHNQSYDKLYHKKAWQHYYRR